MSAQHLILRDILVDSVKLVNQLCHVLVQWVRGACSSLIWDPGTSYGVNNQSEDLRRHCLTSPELSSRCAASWMLHPTPEKFRSMKP